MADLGRVPEGQINQNYSPFKDDFNVLKDMTVPESIKVSGARDNTRFQSTAMSVPERIVLNGESINNERSSELRRDFQDNGVNMGSYMGGMVTPPRTLTVDDTTSAYRGGRQDGGKIESQKANDDNIHKNFEGRTDEERLFKDYFQKDQDESDDLNFRLQTEIVRLNKRVTWLEKRFQEKNSSSLWKTTLFCLLTVINPILIHWLFTKRR